MYLPMTVGSTVALVFVSCVVHTIIRLWANSRLCPVPFSHVARLRTKSEAIGSQPRPARRAPENGYLDCPSVRHCTVLVRVSSPSCYVVTRS